MSSVYATWSRQDSAARFAIASAQADFWHLDDGREIYDFISTSFQANFGHSHEPIRRRIADQLQRLPIASPKADFDLKSSVSQRLIRLIDRGPGKLFYTVSGAESVENALKIARQITGRKIILARQKSYHGASLGALSVTGDWRNEPHLTFDEGTVRIPEHDADADLKRTSQIIETTGPANIAAVILETISGTNGMSMPPRSWWTGIQRLCREFNLMLIIDEVLVGFRRCGADFAFHRSGIEPDMVCLSKAISGGYIPLGAVWTSAAIAEYYEHETLCCGLTNYAHPLGLAALEGVLETLDDESFKADFATLQSVFAERVGRIADRNDVRAVRIAGLMAAIDCDGAAPSWQAAFAAGLHLFSSGDRVILAPPYIAHPTRLNRAFDQLEQLFDDRSRGNTH